MNFKPWQERLFEIAAESQGVKPQHVERFKGSIRPIDSIIVCAIADADDVYDAVNDIDDTIACLTRASEALAKSNE